MYLPFDLVLHEVDRQVEAIACNLRIASNIWLRPCKVILNSLYIASFILSSPCSSYLSHSTSLWIWDCNIYIYSLQTSCKSPKQSLNWILLIRKTCQILMERSEKKRSDITSSCSSQCKTSKIWCTAVDQSGSKLNHRVCWRCRVRVGSSLFGSSVAYIAELKGFHMPTPKTMSSPITHLCFSSFPWEDLLHLIAAKIAL